MKGGVVMGRPRKDSKPAKTARPTSEVTGTIKCHRCKKICFEHELYKTPSVFFPVGRIPYCKDCIEEFYNHFYKQYESEGSAYPEKKAIRRLCMALDMYYDDDLYERAVKNTSKLNISVISSYMKLSGLKQNQAKSYDTTIFKENSDGVIESFVDVNGERQAKPKTIKFFGSGFSDADYVYLQDEYDDWTSRHECNTKAQEEVFKRICFTQLELLKATRAKQDTKDLTATFQKLLETAKLQPKQNAGDTVSDTQTFGTLIDKWENTRPLPEIDDSLKDVDKIGKYINIFFKGHLAKMMGLKNGLSNSYSEFMKKYTVEKPEYENDENNEALFDAIFSKGELD